MTESENLVLPLGQRERDLLRVRPRSESIFRFRRRSRALRPINMIYSGSGESPWRGAARTLFAANTAINADHNFVSPALALNTQLLS